MVAMPRSLLAEERRERILAAVRRDRVVAVADLAAELGVTPMTVRRDINHLAGLDLLRRVHGGAALPRQVRGTTVVRGLTLGLVGPLLDPYWTVVVRRCQAEAAELGVRLEMRDTGQGGRAALPLAKELVADRIDGLLLAPPIREPDRSAVVAWLARQSIRTVLIEREPSPLMPLVQSVASDHEAGGAMAAQHLIDLGHRRIALVRPDSAPGIAQLEAGWRAAVENAGLAPGPVLHSQPPTGASHPALLDRAVGRILDDAMTGVVVSGDPFAVTLVQALRGRGIAIPGDISLVAYGDQLAAQSDPPLTAIRRPRDHVAQLAVRLLADHLRGGAEHRPHHVLITPALVVRGTTSAPA